MNSVFDFNQNAEEEEKKQPHQQEEEPKKPVVLCQHGILDSAAGWMLNGSESIAFKLVEAGFDVWLNNTRGSLYSLEHQHIELDKKNQTDYKRYYDFSLHECGLYDQPAVWNYVMN